MSSTQREHVRSKNSTSLSVWHGNERNQLNFKGWQERAQEMGKKDDGDISDAKILGEATKKYSYD